MNKRLWHSLRITLMMSSDKRVEYLRKHNVFIGSNSTILGGANIGSNVIIGAGSLVNKDIPSNSVVGGVPAKYICSFDEFVEKRKNHRNNWLGRIYI